MACSGGSLEDSDGWSSPVGGAGSFLIVTPARLMPPLCVLRCTHSRRCRIKRMACHVSGSILAEIGGALNGTNLFLAVTSDEAAQELMFNLSNMNLKPFALSLHLTKDVSPKALRTIEGISLLDLYVSEVQDSDLDRVLEMAKAILPQNKGLYELRFPRSPLTSAGCKSLLEKMKKAGVSARLLYIHEEVVLQQDEQEWLEDFARKELGCRFLRLSKEQMRDYPFPY